MNIFVTSDTHGHLEKAVAMYEKLRHMTPDGEDIDMILHAGDFKRDGISLGERLGLPVLACEGNCDGASKRNFLTCETPYGKILLSHGHMERVNYSLDALYYLAKERGCRVACFGHTHVPLFEMEGDVLMVNPGSLSRPRDGTSGSCALLNLTENKADGGIYYYSNVVGDDNKKKAGGGFLRNMINYSDRF